MGEEEDEGDVWTLQRIWFVGDRYHPEQSARMLQVPVGN